MKISIDDKIWFKHAIRPRFPATAHETYYHSIKTEKIRNFPKKKFAKFPKKIDNHKLWSIFGLVGLATCLKLANKGVKPLIEKI